MQEQELFFDFQKYRGSLIPSVGIKGLAQDSRRVQEGFVFIAVRGHQSDGHSHLSAAIQQGARALVVEDVTAVPADFSGSVYLTSDSRKSVDLLAKRFYKDPSSQLKVIGVTGTNGKTSVTYMLEHLLNCRNLPCGVIGTINHHFLDQTWESSLTTPDPILLQQRLSQFLERGARFVAMEVSSHALDQKRVESIQFDAALFTNLTRDHLDYHADMQSYFAAKERLFTELLQNSVKTKKIAVLNNDNSWIQNLALKSEVKTVRFGSNSALPVSYQIRGRSFSRTDFELKIGQHSKHHFSLPMPGEHNVQNMVAALLVLQEFGESLDQLQQVVATFPGVPGRLQKVPCASSRAVFIDYAHSPDALENVLKTLISIRTEIHAKNKIKVLFGCGGDRDKGKRPMMAQVAQKFADQIYLTSDNPRTEDPQQIINEIIVGFTAVPAVHYEVEVDREMAIQKALSDMEPDDVLLIAGKGHEDYQIFGTQKKPFSDFQIAQQWMKEKGL